MSTTFKYETVLKLGTLQYSGHVHQYFVDNTKKLVTFYILPRFGNVGNFIEVHKEGKLIEAVKLYSPKNILVAYFTYYIQYVFILFRYFSRKEKIYFINTLPVFFLGNIIWKQFRQLTIIYWVQDYWVMNDRTIAIFRFFMHFYHKRTRYTLYISDRINRIMNGLIVDTKEKHTVMLGVSKPIYRELNREQKIVLAFIGVLKESQGIGELLEGVSVKKDLRLKLIGTGSNEVVLEIRKTIKKLKIESRVFFPNRFYYGLELKRIIDDCHIGVVLYEEDQESVTYYADPAKVKQYAEFGFPIITTNTPEIAAFIKQYKAGEIIKQNRSELVAAVEKIQSNYRKYTIGVERFCNYFSYDRYYSKKFKFLEE